MGELLGIVSLPGGGLEVEGVVMAAADTGGEDEVHLPVSQLHRLETKGLRRGILRQVQYSVAAVVALGDEIEGGEVLPALQEQLLGLLERNVPLPVAV